ncbi:hypothetical protein DFH06DRAFT_1233247 [Mycena polygramma]|nr:hypothetical protein DFH06DRAFT_1245751 [Mycena polygramma]KAJ7620832.1 hypothetical protein DFH06DRAFT_1233247 [Mycena polygramma]
METKETVSERCSQFPDADVTFKSSDSVLFRVHRKNLEVCTEGFPPADISTQGQIVDLTETSVTLELLFQFMYPHRHPALDTTPFEVLEPLAEASEKYQVFPAMNICHIRLRDMVNEHPVEVAVYAAKHDYPYLVSQVAPMMISMNPVTVVEMLPPYLVVPWIRYVQEWTKVLQNTALVLGYSGTRHTNYSSCQIWSLLAFTCIQRLGAGVQTLRSLDNVFDASKQDSIYDCCKTDLDAWRKRIEDAISEIPKFSSFL